jgi:3-hydroxymyristoyl/3-hydroxydecanoyl-(acyl carrier protein) dehydratase
MSEHFRAFSFVDRITAHEPGSRIRGGYVIPADLEAFPGSLVAEAVGQLAAWAAMAAAGFERRPVAGLAGRIELLAGIRPGQELELAAEMESVDEDAVAYRGTAQVNGTPVIRLEDCVGPMMPVEEFDDPRALRERFALLEGPGAEPGGFTGLPTLGLDPVRDGAGGATRAVLHVPAAAPFFADHFPRRPVFPGSLLMHLNLQLAAALAGELPPPAGGTGWALRIVRDMKLRTFIAPAETLDLEARLNERSDTILDISVETRRGRELVGSARLRFAPGEAA